MHAPKDLFSERTVPQISKTDLLHKPLFRPIKSEYVDTHQGEQIMQEEMSPKRQIVKNGKARIFKSENKYEDKSMACVDCSDDGDQMDVHSSSIESSV